MLAVDYSTVQSYAINYKTNYQFCNHCLLLTLFTNVMYTYYNWSSVLVRNGNALL